MAAGGEKEEDGRRQGKGKERGKTSYNTLEFQKASWSFIHQGFVEPHSIKKKKKKKAKILLTASCHRNPL